MNQNKTSTNPPITVMLADDDIDDQHFFARVLRGLPFQTELITVDNGEALMIWLSENSEKLPDVLFLDLNMPRKTGTECLTEIKETEELKHLPVIVYSTHNHEQNSDNLYQKGAHYYIRKTDIIELAKILHRILNLMIGNKFARPAEENFVFIGTA